MTDLVPYAMIEATRTPMPELPMLRADTIPASLKTVPHWVTWRYEPRPEGVGKPHKKPLTPSGRPADITNPRTWSSFDNCVESYTRGQGIAGVGYVLTKSDPVVGIDLDNCLVGDQLAPDAQEITYLLDSYTEISPSGRGLRILVNADVGEWGGRRRGGLEIYSDRRYLTITGGHLAGAPATLQPRIEELREVYRRYLADKATRPAPATPDRVYIQATDAEVVERMARGKLGDLYLAIMRGDVSQVVGRDQSRADTLLLNALAFYTRGDSAQMRRIMLASPRATDRVTKWCKPVKGQITYLDYQIEDSIAYESSRIKR